MPPSRDITALLSFHGRMLGIATASRGTIGCQEMGDSVTRGATAAQRDDCKRADEKIRSVLRLVLLFVITLPKSSVSNRSDP